MVIERKKYNIDPIKNTRRITMNLKRQTKKQKFVININRTVELIGLGTKQEKFLFGDQIPPLNRY